MSPHQPSISHLTHSVLGWRQIALAHMASVVFAGLSRQLGALRLLVATSSSSSASLSKSSASTLECASTIIHTNFDDRLRTTRMSAPPSSAVRNFSSTHAEGRVKLHVANLPPNATYASIRQTFEKRLPSGTPIIDCFLSGGGYAFVTVPTNYTAGDDDKGDGGGTSSSSSFADALLNNLGEGGGMVLDGNLLRVTVAARQAQKHTTKIKKLNDDGGPVGGGSIIITATAAATSSSSSTAEDELKQMSLGQLADMSTIPGWTLVHNPPRHNTPRGSLVGTVVSTKMAKTVNVAVDRYRIVPKYRKRWKFTRKFMAHDEAQVCNEGDLVMIVPCQKISRHKHYMVREIVRRKGQL